MASTVLPNGIIIPEKYSRDWYNDLYHNWQELDNLLGGGTPKDGTLTIQKNGTNVGTFSANQATNETIDITVPDVNNATLTIQKNGTTVQTFTANQSTNATANITVPTKTSDLTNDSGFITEDTTKIPLAGSNAISGSLIPATTNAYDLGTSVNKWKSFNGINPGALSLPSTTFINLDTTNFDVTSTIIGTFTPTVDGWAILSMSQKNKHFGIWILYGSYRATFHSVYHNSDYMIFALIPVRANVTMTVYCTADDIDSTRKVDWLRLFPCQGNV